MSKTIYGVNRGNLGELERIVRGKCTGFIVRGTGYGLTDIEIFNINRSEEHTSELQSH